MNKVLLMILDGWGIGKHDKTDAIFNTPTPFMNSLSEKYPHAQLLTCGENVGLPDGQMGNSNFFKRFIFKNALIFVRYYPKQIFIKNLVLCIA